MTIKTTFRPPCVVSYNVKRSDVQSGTVEQIHVVSETFFNPVSTNINGLELSGDVTGFLELSGDVSGILELGGLT